MKVTNISSRPTVFRFADLVEGQAFKFFCSQNEDYVAVKIGSDKYLSFYDENTKSSRKNYIATTMRDTEVLLVEISEIKYVS